MRLTLLFHSRMYPEITQLFVATQLRTVISLKTFLTPDIHTSLSNLGYGLSLNMLNMLNYVSISKLKYGAKRIRRFFHILQLYVLTASILFIK